MAPWTPGDPEQYERFAAERSAPFWDLLSLVRPVPGGRVVDLGCGNGELTAALHRRSGSPPRTLGLDSSPAMLERAAALEGAGSPVRAGRHRRLRPGWLGRRLLQRRLALGCPTTPGCSPGWSPLLNQGGQLAVQMPANHDHPSHVVAAEPGRRRAVPGRPGRSTVAPHRSRPRSGTPSCSTASAWPTSTSGSRFTCTTWPPATRSSSGSRGPCSPTTRPACQRPCSRSSWPPTAAACSPSWRTPTPTATPSSACCCGAAGVATERAPRRGPVSSGPMHPSGTVGCLRPTGWLGRPGSEPRPGGSLADPKARCPRLSTAGIWALFASPGLPLWC